ncbi:MAG: DMT family transporter [Thermotogae bacterium]|nr:DMT family transporter [Thermotogota bacterium]
MTDRKKAVILMLISSFSFAFMGAFVKLSGDLPTFQKAFFRNFFAVIITGFILYRKKQRFFGRKENIKFLILRSAFGTAGMIAYFYSIDHLLLADSSMINKLNPFFVSIFAYLILKEKFSRIQFPALIIAFTGAFFIIKPQFDFETVPALIALLSAVFSGVAYTMVRFLGNRKVFIL